ncbi:MAG: hypothetical protein ACT4P6_22065, partial [Gemmatimonadaceae bacterium]
MSPTTDTTQDTVFSLLRRPDLRASRAQWAALAVLVVLAWFGATSFIGRYRPNDAARIIDSVIPGSSAFPVMLVVALILAALGVAFRRTRIACAALIVAGFLAGHLLYAWLYELLGVRITIPFTRLSHALHFAAARLLWGAAILGTTLPLWYLTFGRDRGSDARLTFRWGNWRVAARDFSAKQPPQRYTRILLGGYTLVVVVLLVLGQASVGFRPIRTGALFTL